MKKVVSIILALVMVASMLSGCVATEEPDLNVQPSTTAPAVTSPSTTVKLPTTEVRLNREMNIWFHGDVHLQCEYVASADVCVDGETITVTLQITNAGAAFRYTGALEDQFGTALLRSDTNPEYTIESKAGPNTDDVTPGEFAHLAETSMVYQFTVPENAPEDHYTLETTLFGNSIVFDLRAALRPKYIPCLTDLSEEAQKIVVGEAYYSESYEEWAKFIPIYCEAGDVYVSYFNFGGDNVVTHEIVNGLRFSYTTSSHIEVYTPSGIMSLSKAFATGLLNAEQIQQVHDNWRMIGIYIDEEEFGHYLKLRSNIRLNHWGENSWSCIYAPYNGSRHDAGDTIQIKVTLINNGPEITFDHIKNEVETTAWLVSDLTGVTLESYRFDGPYIGVNNGKWEPGESADIFFTFEVPEDYYEGAYTFVFSVGGEEMRFDEKAVKEARKITTLGIVASQFYFEMFGPDSYSDPVLKQNFYMPAYGQYIGELDGKGLNIYAYIYPTDSADGRPTTEIVNGLAFEVPEGYQFYVFAYRLGTFTLTEAFEKGILTEEMLQDIYDNHTFLQNCSSALKP